MKRGAAEQQTDFVVTSLRKLREERGISQVTLARLAGISRSGLGHIESARVTPSLSSVLRICAALEIELKDLLASYQK